MDSRERRPGQAPQRSIAALNGGFLAKPALAPGWEMGTMAGAGDASEADTHTVSPSQVQTRQQPAGQPLLPAFQSLEQSEVSREWEPA